MTAAGAAEVDPAGTPGPQLLLVEDEESIGDAGPHLSRARRLPRRLGAHGRGGAAVARDRRPRLVVLDIGLPGAGRVRGLPAGSAPRSTVPVMMLTARDEEADRVAGLEVGADDYVSKPFSPRELVARGQGRPPPLGARPRRVELLELGDVAVDAQAREVTRRRRDRRADGARSSTCSRTCSRTAGIVLSRDQLLDRVWGMSYAGRDANRRRPRRPAAPQARPARARSGPCAARATRRSRP